MHLVPAGIDTNVVPFTETERVGGGQRTARRVLTVWLTWGEPGASFYHCKSIPLCLN